MQIKIAASQTMHFSKEMKFSHNELKVLRYNIDKCIEKREKIDLWELFLTQKDMIGADGIDPKSISITVLEDNWSEKQPQMNADKRK